MVDVPPEASSAAVSGAAPTTNRTHAPRARIWFVNHYADPPDGLATRTFDLARELVRMGFEVSIFTSNYSHYHFRRTRAMGPRLWQTENIAGVRFVWVKTIPYRRNDWRRILNMLSFALLATSAGVTKRGRPGLVIGVSVHPLAALAGYVIAALRRARFFFEVTDLWPETLIQFGRLRRGSIVARSLLKLERFLYNRAELVIMLWRDTGDYVESVGVPRSKILWIPHGVDPRKYPASESYDGGRGRPFRITYMGGFVAANALDTILNAARVLLDRGRSDILFSLVGAGTLRQHIADRARDLRLTNVEFHEPVPKTEVPRTLATADALIYGLQDLPIYQYGISTNKVTDYLASGRPIVFFGTSSYDPVSEAGAGMSSTPDPVALADCIERLVELSPEERIAMGQRGRAFMLQNHSIPVLTERLVAAIDRFVPA